MNTMSNPMLERIQREAGIPNLIDVLVERLTPTDLQSLMLEVYRRRAADIQPGQLLERYEKDRFVRPAESDPALLAHLDLLAWSLLPEQYTALELSPVCALGTNATVATVDQNKIVTTIRNSEVVADVTNVLALECASRRRQLLRQHQQSRERIHLCASQRVVRAQATQNAPAMLAHFHLLGLCTAGRDEGSFQFETGNLREHLAFYIQLLRALPRLGLAAQHVRIAFTDLEEGRRTRALTEQVLQPLMRTYPDVTCAFDPERTGGRGYYTGACFHIYATNPAGREFELIDGGFTTWTQQLLSNKKERLLISGLGSERLCSLFNATTTRS
jgi:hypothetical protein